MTKGNQSNKLFVLFIILFLIFGTSFLALYNKQEIQPFAQASQTSQTTPKTPIDIIEGKIFEILVNGNIYVLKVKKEIEIMNYNNETIPYQILVFKYNGNDNPNLIRAYSNIESNILNGKLNFKGAQTYPKVNTDIKYNILSSISTDGSQIFTYMLSKGTEIKQNNPKWLKYTQNIKKLTGK